MLSVSYLKSHSGFSPDAILVNVFSGLFNNPLFYGIWITTAILQALIVEYGSLAFKVADEGLELKYWIVSMVLGLGAFPVYQIIRVVYGMFLNKDQ